MIKVKWQSANSALLIHAPPGECLHNRLSVGVAQGDQSSTYRQIKDITIVDQANPESDIIIDFYPLAERTK